MIETILAITAGTAAIFLIGVLVHRKVRQWRIARALRIRSAHGIAETLWLTQNLCGVIGSRHPAIPA